MGRPAFGGELADAMKAVTDSYAITALTDAADAKKRDLNAEEKRRADGLRSGVLLTLPPRLTGRGKG
eukprot:gene51511-35426_t